MFFPNYFSPAGSSRKKRFHYLTEAVLLIDLMEQSMGVIVIAVALLWPAIEAALDCSSVWNGT